ncbi:ABC transporter permease subunit [Streptomyces olivoreticuli]|uniref:ABC transporter permease subunit n=1 Tax=Streptomyces olivoreticuli TaxID=68246 RepID=UPI000E244CC6|nr:ABC transporter permease subunit [Streptomyces olivoreticuli]
MTAPQHPQPAAPQAPAFAPEAPQWTGGYLSPIPVRKATLADALASEWTKIRSLRSTMWTLGVMVALVFGIGCAIAAAATAVDDNGGGGKDMSALSFGVFGVLLGVICVITLGVLTISSEFGTGMIRTTLTACPNRARVLTAKAIVFFLLVFTITLVSTTLVGMVAESMLQGQWTDRTTGEMWLRATVGVSLFVALIGLLALAVGTIVRHSAGAITAMLGLMLLPLVMTMFMYASALSEVRKFLLQYSIPYELFVLFASGTDGPDSSGPTGWDPVWIMMGVVAVALGGAYAALMKRDA